MKFTAKNFILLLIFGFSFLSAQSKIADQQIYLKPTYQLTSEAALSLMKKVSLKAKSMNVKVTIAILDGSGNTISILRGDNIGPHNTEAARRKAYTSLSTKTPTLELMRNAERSADAKNLNTLPELLLLSGGSPIYYNGEIVGAIGVAGGGSAENDDIIAKSAEILEAGISTKK